MFASMQENMTCRQLFNWLHVGAAAKKGSEQEHTSDVLLWLARESLGTRAPGKSIALATAAAGCLADGESASAAERPADFAGNSAGEGLADGTAVDSLVDAESIVSVWPGTPAFSKSVLDWDGKLFSDSGRILRPGVAVNLGLLLLRGVLVGSGLRAVLITRGGRDAFDVVRSSGGSRGFLALILAEWGGLCAALVLAELPLCRSM